MIRIFNAYFPTRTVLLVLSEVVLLIAAFVGAVMIWEGNSTNSSIFLMYENGFARIFFVVAVVVVLMYYFDMYSSTVISNRREVFTRLVGVLGSTFIAMAAAYVVIPDVKLNATVLWIGLLSASITLLIWRSVFLLVNRSARMAEFAVLFGDGPLAVLLAEEIRKRTELGVRVVGAVVRNTQLDGIPVIEASSLADYVRREGVRRIIVTAEDRRGTLPVRELLELKAQGVRIQDGPGYYESVTGKLDLGSLRLGWLLFSPGFHVSGFLRAYKRIFSFVVSLVFVLAASPIILLVALLIRLDSKGPVLFKQARVGENGKIFMMYKFRSMVANAEKLPLSPAADQDPRITRVGRWIRPRRLDELPQLLNILKGDMAFVGPRPFVPAHEELYAECIPFYRQRWLVKPGLTGWAQINRGYNETIEENRDKLAYDLFYIRNISIGLDIYIILSTAKILLLGRGR